MENIRLYESWVDKKRSIDDNVLIFFKIIAFWELSAFFRDDKKR